MRCDCEALQTAQKIMYCSVIFHLRIVRPTCCIHLNVFLEPHCSTTAFSITVVRSPPTVYHLHPGLHPARYEPHSSCQGVPFAACPIRDLRFRYRFPLDVCGYFLHGFVRILNCLLPIFHVTSQLVTPPHRCLKPGKTRKITSPSRTTFSLEKQGSWVLKSSRAHRSRDHQNALWQLGPQSPVQRAHTTPSRNKPF